jgi:hypothetical protein
MYDTAEQQSRQVAIAAVDLKDEARLFSSGQTISYGAVSNAVEGFDLAFTSWDLSTKLTISPA